MEIKLPCGRTALIDDVDTGLIEGHRLYSAVRGGVVYVECRAARNAPKLYLHRLIAGTPKGMVTDHRDGDGLNNRRSNLRTCKQALNVLNTAKKRPQKKFKGVFFAKARGRWWAQIARDGRRHFLGYHSTEEAAARAYDEAATKLHGEFARLNYTGRPVLGWL